MVRDCIERSFKPRALGNIEANPRSPPHWSQLTNPNSRLSLSLSSKCNPGEWTSSVRRRKYKRWTTQFGSRACLTDGFGWTDVRRIHGFGDPVVEHRNVVSWDNFQNAPCEVPVHASLVKRKPRLGADGGRPFTPSYARYRPSSQQRALMGASSRDDGAAAPTSGSKGPRGTSESPVPQLVFHVRGGGGVEGSRPRTSQSVEWTARSQLHSRSSHRSNIRSAGGPGGTRPAPWDVMEFLVSMQRRPQRRTSLSSTHIPTTSSILLRPSTAPAANEVAANGLHGPFEPERALCILQVPTETEPTELVAALATFGEVCYASVQPPDDGGELGWALVTFVHYGSAAGAGAKGTVAVGAAPPMRIEKLSTRIAEATLYEEQQARDAFKHFTRTQHIFLSIRNILEAGQANQRVGGAGLTENEILLTAQAGMRRSRPRALAQSLPIASRYCAHGIDL